MLPGDFQRLPEPIEPLNDIIPWFQREDNPILYETAVDIYKNHFSGLMVIKSISEESHRAVFITELGIKVFDMEFFSKGDFILHYCLEAMNRRSIIRTLQNDIGLMIRNVPDQNIKYKVFSDRLSHVKIIMQRSGPGTRYYFMETGSHNINKIIQHTGLRKKVNLQFYSTSDNRIDSIKISHYNIKLDIQLTPLHENKSGISE
jgi:hypothetical protein